MSGAGRDLDVKKSVHENPEQITCLAKTYRFGFHSGQLIADTISLLAWTVAAQAKIPASALPDLALRSSEATFASRTSIREDRLGASGFTPAAVRTQCLRHLAWPASRDARVTASEASVLFDRKQNMRRPAPIGDERRTGERSHFCAAGVSIEFAAAYRGGHGRYLPRRNVGMLLHCRTVNVTLPTDGMGGKL